MSIIALGPSPVPDPAAGQISPPSTVLPASTSDRYRKRPLVPSLCATLMSLGSSFRSSLIVARVHFLLGLTRGRYVGERKSRATAERRRVNLATMKSYW
jgi:hypothetical protein